MSLRDVAATIVDVLGFKAGSPFPGSSLARFWNAKETAAKRARASSDPALAEVLPNDGSNRDSAGLPKKRWPLGAVIEEDWSYIRHEEEQREELFHFARTLKNSITSRAIRPQCRRSSGCAGAGPSHGRSARATTLQSLSD